MAPDKGFQGYYADCYVLTNKRTKKFIHSFLDNFLPNRQESADEYEIPQYSENPTTIYKTADELIDHLEKSTQNIHTIYWSNKDNSDIKGVMCFFTNDAQIILGIYCETLFPNTSIEEKYFKKLQKFCGSNNGYITYEEPSTHDTKEFLKKVMNFKQKHGNKSTNA